MTLHLHYAGGDKPSLSALLLVVPRIAVAWYNVGLKLGAKDFTLNIIEQDHKGDQEKCCRVMLQKWLNARQDCGDCPRTWDALLPVVQNVVGCQASAFIKKEILNWKVEEGEPMEQGPVESECVCLYMLCAVTDQGQPAVCDIVCSMLFAASQLLAAAREMEDSCSMCLVCLYSSLSSHVYCMCV